MKKEENMKIWEDIKGFEGYYQISNNGEIKSLSRTRLGRGNKPIILKEKILKPQIINSGYLKITLKKESKEKGYLVHRLVALHFINNPFDLPEVNHLDGDKINNNDWNLEWTNSKGNKKHAWELGLYRKQYAENNSNYKLSDIIIDDVRTKYKSGGYTQKQLAIENNVTQGFISYLINNKRR